MLYFFETCVASIRTIPVLQHDPMRPEDLDTASEDHAVDMIRYGCMARPWLRSPRPPEMPATPTSPTPTIDWSAWMSAAAA